jgi:hypothetical protein
MMRAWNTPQAACATVGAVAAKVLRRGSRISPLASRRAMHGLNIVPDHRIVSAPDRHLDELRRGRVLGELAQEVRHVRGPLAARPITARHFLPGLAPFCRAQPGRPAPRWQRRRAGPERFDLAHRMQGCA